MRLTYHLLPAQSGQTRSLVILLHGFGANGAGMMDLGRALSSALPDTDFLAPDAPDPVPGGPGGRMWFSIPELDGSTTEEADRRLQVSARLLDAFLDEQLAGRGLAASATALFGFSQGAGLAFEVAPRRSDQLAGVVAIAGRMKRKEALATEMRSKPPFLILTGGDDRLSTTAEIEATTAALSDCAIPAMHVMMAHTGHGISVEGLNSASAFLNRVIAPSDAV